MRSPRSESVRSSLVGVALVALASSGLAGQELRDVVSKEIAVGRDEAALRIEFDGGDDLAIAFRSGQVLIADQAIGEYVEGGALDTAWRTLLGTAVALENGPLAQALVAWAPPEGLEGASARAGSAIDRALEETLRDAPAPAAAPPAPAPGGGALAALLGRAERLQGLSQALAGVDTRSLQLTVGEDLVVGPGEEVEATVVVVDGDLTVEGVVRGDVVVLGGDVVLEDGGRVTGDVRLTDGRVVERGGTLVGELIEIEPDVVLSEREIQERIREEVRSATRQTMSEVVRPDRARGSSSFWRPLERVGRGVGGAVGNLFTALVLGLVGGVTLYFAGPRLDVVAETVRRSPGRAAMVGAAGAFLVLPAWVLGVIALAVSIIGIPALLIWVPLFPLAVVAAGAVGYLAVARNVGAWVSRQKYPYMDWVRVTNPYSLIFGGVLVLMAPFVAGDVLSIVPFLGALHGLLVAAGVVATVFAVLSGFGAVILTRGGRPNELWGDDFFGGSTVGTEWEESFDEPSTTADAGEAPAPDDSTPTRGGPSGSPADDPPADDMPEGSTGAGGPEGPDEPRSGGPAGGGAWGPSHG